jgi:hypothetical protein
VKLLARYRIRCSLAVWVSTLTFVVVAGVVNAASPPLLGSSNITVTLDNGGILNVGGNGVVGSAQAIQRIASTTGKDIQGFAATVTITDGAIVNAAASLGGGAVARQEISSINANKVTASSVYAQIHSVINAGMGVAGEGDLCDRRWYS